MFALRLLRSIPRNGWLWLGLTGIAASHLVCWLPGPQDFTLPLLLPLLVTTICIMHLRQAWLLIVLTVTASILVMVIIDREFFWLNIDKLGGLLLVQSLIGLSSYLVDVVPWSYAQSHTRLADRFKRQSKRLQTVRESQEDAERAVQQFKSDRRTLLEHLPVHVVHKDCDSRFTFVSRSFCELVDKTYDQLIGKTDFDVFPEDAATKFVEDDRQVMESGEAFSDVERTQLPDGTVSYMRVRKAPILDSDGNVIGVQGIFWDVTEEHTSRQELQRIESMTHALINAALDAVLIVDSDGQVLEANPASEKILGYTRDAAHQHPPLGTIMHTSLEEPGERASDPEDRQTTFQRKIPIGEILRAATGKRIEAKLRRSDDQWFDGEISTHPLDVDGAQGWAIFIRDISRRKKSEKDLLAAKNAAEQANAAKTEFVANVSHELRTPLTGIIGLHDLLDRNPLDDRQREYLKLAKMSAGNLLTIIDDLLDFSKIEAGHLEIESVPFSLIDCIEEATHALAARAQFKGLEILIDLDDPLPGKLIGDPHRIRQILLNLAGNAIKFTERGEIRIRAAYCDKDYHRKIEVEKPARFRFEVHDSGIGIAEDKRMVIFEAFRQADSSTTRRYGGTGLGLTICRDLVMKMSGEIGVTEAKDLDGHQRPGSCFYFELPLVIAETAAAQQLAGSKIGQHVVIAAAPSSWRELLQREVKRLGFEQTVMSVSQLLHRDPPGLFAAGNHTIVIADYRELNSVEDITAPVVTKWILLAPLYHEEHDRIPNWLHYSDVCWLARPIRKRDLRDALVGKQAEVEPQAGLLPTTGNRRSADILLVEDSPISQTVLRDMLTGLGHQVTISENGCAAIKKCSEKLYDLVLMDIQMPDVDGLEATKMIRQAEAGLGRRQRICALTAHATVADRAKCEEVGMNGFLVKPISLEALANAVFEATCGYPPSDATGSPPVTTSQDRHDDHERIQQRLAAPSDFDLERAFMDAPDWPELLRLMNNNENLLKDVLALLTREAPKLGRDFQQALRDNSMSAARRAIHTLKGNVRHVGLNRIAAFAEHVEHLARDEQSDKLQQVSKLVRDLANAIADWSEDVLESHA